MIKAIFFDLDGTLLPLDEDYFAKVYFKLLSDKMYAYGFDKEKLINNIWQGTKLMYLNNGKKSNEDVFWDYFSDVYGKEVLDKKEIFDKFYSNEFKQTQMCCKENKLAKEIVRFAKKHFNYVVLSTNPIFPLVGTKTRMSYVDLDVNDFDYVTSYENSYYSKPNPLYFIELLKKYNLKSAEVIVFGNNTYEDGQCAFLAGIKCYLVGDYIINNPKATQKFTHLKMEEVIPLLQEIDTENKKSNH